MDRVNLLRPFHLLARAAILLSALAAAGEPMLSEFMADNEKTLKDQDGAYSDWIEIYNPALTATNLNGWYLTDNEKNLVKWRFPAVVLAPRSNIIVFASGKNRATTTNELHTNFQLSKGGEYLALVRPDGVTVATEFAPAFPDQVTDFSYGITIPSTDVVLAATGTACRAFVPTNNTPPTWRNRVFDDSLWPTGSFAVGYFDTNASPNYAAEVGLNVQTQMYGLATTIYMRSPFEIANTAAVLKLTLRMRYNDGYAVYLNGGYAAKSSSAPAAGTLTNTSAATATNVATSYVTNDLTAAWTNLVNGTNVLAIHGLNVNATSPDLFILPQFVARIATADAPQTNYLAYPTPRQMNGGNEAVRLPQAVSFSMPSGIYTNNFSLTLSGAAGDQTIRYTFDGRAPCTTSPAYASPMLINTSRCIRAAVFSAAGQTGQITTVQYTFISGGSLSFTSNLPLIIIHNNDPLWQGAIVSQDVKVACFMHVIDRETNGYAKLRGPPALSARCGISVRGSSSAGNAKKPYAVEFRNELDQDEKHPMLDLASDSDWVLLGPYNFDRTFMHDVLMHEVSRQMGRWAPRTRFCEAFLAKTNGVNVTTNDYIGLYVIEEKIKIAESRVDINKLTTMDSGMPDVSGGYVFKIDRQDPDEFAWTTRRSNMLVITSLKSAELLTSQKGYFTNALQQFEDALYSATFTNPATGYAAHIDVGGWIDHHILNVMPKNVDALRLSAYMYKDRLEKIVAGPGWDYDRSLDSYDARDDAYTNWNGTSDATVYFGYRWWQQLSLDPDFMQAWIDRWQTLRTSVLSETNLFATIDGFALQIGTNAPARDYARWGMTPSTTRGGSFTGEVGWLKRWLTNRVAWIDSQFTTRPAIDQPSAVVTSGTIVTFSGSNIYYAIGGADPRAAGGVISTSAALYSSPLVITSSTFVTIRSLNDTNWSGSSTALFLVNEYFATTGDVVVSEINYHPLGATIAENAAAPYAQRSNFEFIELKNIGSRRVNLFGMRFADTKPVSQTTLGACTLNPGECAVVAANSAAFQARYGTSVLARVIGFWSDGTLDDGGERWTLSSRDGVIVDTLSYGTSGDWPGRPDGKGSTLEYCGTSFDPASRSNPANWRASSEFHGSPGWDGAGPDQRVVINELLTHTDLPQVDAIELLNTTTNDIDIDGWWLCDQISAETARDYLKYRIANGTVISAGCYRVYDATDFDPNGIWNTNASLPAVTEFAFDAAHGDEAWLIRGDTASNPVAFIDHFEFAAARNGETFGRWPNGTGEFYPLVRQTLEDATSTNIPFKKLGASNDVPRVGPLLVSEIHYHPVIGDTNDNQFIEILNAGTNAQPLANWTLRGPADFYFTTNHLLNPGQVIVLVSYSPTDTTRIASFNSAFGLTNMIALGGPWESNDHLRSSGHVTLYRADDPPAGEPDFYPQILEEDVTYSNASPWAAGADGGGFSLTRIGTGGVSRLAESWMAEVPTPGSTGLTFAAWRTFYFPTGGIASAASADADADGNANFAEYALGSNPLEPSQTNEASVIWINGACFYAYGRLADRGDVLYAVQKSTNLAQWIDAADIMLQSVPPREIRGVPLPADADSTNLFYRLLMRQSP